MGQPAKGARVVMHQAVGVENKGLLDKLSAGKHAQVGFEKRCNNYIIIIISTK